MINEFMNQTATSQAFYRYAAPNLGIVYALFWIGIAGLVYVAVQSAREAMKELERTDKR